MQKRKIWLLIYGIVLPGMLLAVHCGNRAVTAFAQRNIPPCAHRIVIDPGHGGVDGGATSCTGILESRFNLEISLRLRDLLHLLGCRTRMIRTEDVSVYKTGESIAQKKVSDLKERVRMVNETPNALLVSIHQNNFPDGRYAGAQVFYAATPDSQLLAKALQTALVQNLNPGSNRKEKKSSGVYLMEHITRPGVLIECGFLSNPEEERKLRSEDYQQKLCCVIAVTLLDHLSNT